MASYQSQGFGSNTSYHSKLSKPRTRTVVKPILRKLHSHSDSNSLDLDRPWEEQTSQALYASLDYGTNDDDLATTNGVYHPAYTNSSSGSGLGLSGPVDVGVGGIAARNARDVSFTFAPDMTETPSRTRFSHTRTISGASHTSVATSASGGRNGSFVHPFQQTPRASTPPLSYALASADVAGVGTRDYSPTINEDEDDIDPLAIIPSMNATLSHPLSNIAPTSPSVAQSSSALNGPALATQRTLSSSEITPASRMPTSRSHSSPNGDVSRVTAVVGRIDLRSNSTDSTAPSPMTVHTAPSPQITSSPSSSFSPISPLRTSLDKAGIRSRSRSEMDPFTRQEQVRQARIKFEQKERAKEEKYAREQTRKQERADTKDAQKSERVQGHSRQGSFGKVALGSRRNSSGTETPPSEPRTSTGNAQNESSAEKTNLPALGYAATAAGHTHQPKADDVRFKTTKRKTPKRKPTGAWTAFVLWLRTKLLRLGR